ncbi:ESX-3 secretion system eccC3 domain protein [Mycobacterium xenopi 3993]|nr:ESX-3 secretion system eccC3 domain protein [Mycobacterium xenopi 3993]
MRDVPVGIDLAKVSRITVLGEAGEVRAVLRSLIAQAVTWHDPTVLGIALATPDLEDANWSWLKWLPHVDIPGQLDGVGPARYLSTNADELSRLLGPALADRPVFTGGATEALRHLLVVVDDPDFDVNASPLAAARAGLPSSSARRHLRTANSIRIPSARFCVSRTAISIVGSPAVGSATSIPPTSSMPTRPATWPGSCRGGIPIPPTPGCARRPPGAPRSPRCWAFPMPRHSTCLRCGRRARGSRNSASRSGSPRPASR